MYVPDCWYNLEFKCYLCFDGVWVQSEHGLWLESKGLLFQLNVNVYIEILATAWTHIVVTIVMSVTGLICRALLILVSRHSMCTYPTCLWCQSRHSWFLRGTILNCTYKAYVGKLNMLQSNAYLFFYLFFWQPPWLFNFY